jgi:UDP-GlcNAc:undecaprenyl-phosphate/decaprenyl-phosphate GlcNAc-1-phosphate transferase
MTTVMPIASYWFLTLSAFFGMALLVSAICTMLILKKHLTIGLDQPDNQRKTHVKAVPRLGGLPIFVALVAGTVVAVQVEGADWKRWWPVILCNALMFGVGFSDDLKALGARVKLVGQIGVAIILYSLGVSIDMLSNPFGEGSLNLGLLSLPLTVAWLVAIPNIVNLIDGMDGLATGFGLFLCLTLSFVGYSSAQHDLTLISLIMAGALAGFLIFNFPPAKIFLGDGGAYLIGFFVASSSLLGSNKGSIMAALLVMLVALGVPILDTLFAIIRRAIRGVPIFRADAEHIHHRLILLGYTKGQALAALYAVCAALSLVGISILLTKGLAIPVAGAVIFLLALGAARYLGYIRSWSAIREQIADAMERRREIQFVNAHATMLELEIERCDTYSEFRPLLVSSLDRIGFKLTPEPGMRSLEIPVGSKASCRLYYSATDEAAIEWSHRAQELAGVFVSTLEKWGDVTGIPISRIAAPSEHNATAPTTSGPPMPLV